MQKVLRTGNSLAVVIPSQFAEIMGVKSGDNVRVVGRPEAGKVTYIFSGSKQLPLELASKKRNKQPISVQKNT